MEVQMSGTQAQENSGDRFVAATDERSVVEKALFRAKGKVSGHGVGSWLPASPTWAPDIGKQKLDSDTPQDVVALLDTGIKEHSWLMQDGQNLWFTDPTSKGRELADPEQCQHPAGEKDCYGSHAGHATFLAGAIRRVAPNAGLLSYHVLNAHGEADDVLVVEALERLASTELNDWLRDRRQRLAVVLLAFGRSGRPDELEITLMRDCLRKLAARNVMTVAAAGNDGTDALHYPAAFAAEPGLGVTAVGGLASESAERARFSNYAPWIGAWRRATNIFGAMPFTAVDPTLGEPERKARRSGADPLNGFAWWSGTSFAAAEFAGELVKDNRHPAAPLLPHNLQLGARR
jgi:subtilisin family serine protease